MVVRLNTVLRAVLILLLILSLNPLQAQTQPPEYLVKLYLLGQVANNHISWPSSVGIDKNKKPFVIGVYGDNPFKSFANIFAKRRIKNKKVVIKHIKRRDQILGCHVLFVSGIPVRRLTDLLELTWNKPILTVGDTEGYAHRGIHLNMVKGKLADVQEGSTVLEVNEIAVQQAGLVIDDDLLKMEETKIVRTFQPYEEKISLLEPITRFITWPPVSKMETSKTFIIEVIGHNFFGSYLEKFFKKNTLKNKPVVVRYISKVEEINNPHLLFISQSLKDNIPEIISYTKDKPILTMGDTNGFRQAGVHINFWYERLRLCFEINEKAARAAGFEISYHLSSRAKDNPSIQE